MESSAETVQDRQRRKATPGAPPSPDNPTHNPVHTFTTSEPDKQRKATKKNPLLGHQNNSGTTKNRRKVASDSIGRKP